MRITKLRAFQPLSPGSPSDWRTQLGQIVVEIETDSGLTGLGVGGGGRAAIHIIETVLSDLLLGEDATDVEQLQKRMLDHTTFYGRKGIVVMAISGLDLALWDLRGKASRLPIARLLSPDVDLTQPLPTYTTTFDETATAEALAAGHSAIKLHVERFGDDPDPAEIADLVKRSRTLLGPERDLMIDAFARWNIETTLRVAEAIAPFNIRWLEEPLPPDDLCGYERLVAECPIPIAGGEHEYTTAGFRELIDRRLHAVLQPDVNWCGGLTTLVEVYRMAQAAGLTVCPHRGSEPFALPALAALDPNPLAESPRTWFNCLRGAPVAEQGQISVSQEPGFGVSLNTSFREE